MNTNKKVKVSVIVPTYNHEQYIEHCLNSILSQKVYFGIEILVGDDASTDTTRSILEKYKTKYADIIKLTLREENVGPTRNSYELLMQAQGKYIAFCEGDDYWCDDDKLQIQYDFLETHPEYIACTHKVLLVDKYEKTKKNQNLYWVKNKEVFTLKDFEGVFLPGHLSTTFRRNIYLSGKDYSIQYRANSNIGDRTAVLIYLAQGNFYQIDRVMSCYRQIAYAGENNISSKMYVENSNSVKIDFEYTLALEQYAKDNIKQKVDFDYHKCELLLRVMRNKAKQDKSKRMARKIFKSIRNKKNMPILFMRITLRKIKTGRIRDDF